MPRRIPRGDKTKRIRPHVPSVKGIYFYGYPHYGTSESNVAAQWIFDESSGAAVDKVSSISLTAGGSNGPAYNVIQTGDFASLSPGCQFEARSTAQSSGYAYFAKGSAESTMNPGTGDFTLEMWLVCDDLGDDADQENVQYIFSTQKSGASPVQGMYVYIDLNSATKFIVINLTADDSTTLSKTFIVTGALDGDDLMHKLRFVADRDGNLELFLDGTSEGTQALTTLDGKTIDGNDVIIGASLSLSESTHGSIYETRFSLNATNNSGGPNGG